MYGSLRYRLDVFDNASLLTTYEKGGTAKTIAVDPESIARQLSRTGGSFQIATGLMNGETLYMLYQVQTETSTFLKKVIFYRPPQITGLFMEGTSTALHVPLPGLILVCAIEKKGQTPHITMVAVKETPTEQTELFRVPLPHMGERSCMGSVKIPGIDKPASEHWSAVLGSEFGSHTPGQRSQKYPTDIRQMLVELDATDAQEYPVEDLIPLNTTLRHYIQERSE